MALNKQALKSGILQLMNEMRTKTENADNEFAERLANLIDAFVKSGTVTVTVATGIPVSTAGTAAAQTGATTSTGTGTGSMS